MKDEVENLRCAPVGGGLGWVLGVSAVLWLLMILFLDGCSKEDAGAGSAASPAAMPEESPVAVAPEKVAVTGTEEKVAKGAEAPERLKIVATIAPMYCFAKNVAGDLADVEMVVPAGISPRGYVPAEAELRQIAGADVVVENGFGFEEWMDELVAHGGLKAGVVRVIAARGAGPGIPGLPGDPDTPPGDAPLDAAGPPDAHVWLDPMMAIKEVQNIRDALMARDPAHANEYLANENRYEAKLRDLDDEVGQALVGLPKRKLYCPEFTYFLSRYEMRVAASAKGADVKVWVKVARPYSLNRKGLPGVLVDPMETGSASTEFYEDGTLANVAALRKGLGR
jgi:ABC-type Zn uptake system ZnuABC Zn-binding protein ZnuA